ncbi:MAG: ribosome-associated translation inhibitor RaiA [Chlamydiales bacterium]|nr:ribosome-associated translation inhibitor RaiA [Chlamydiales bacterium]
MSQKARESEAVNEYNISVQGRHLHVTDSMKDYILEKLSKIERLSHNIIDVLVTLEIQKLEHRVDIALKFNHFKIKVHANCNEMYPAIDKAVDRLQSQVKKYKDKIRDHQLRGASISEVDVTVYKSLEDEINDEIDAENAKCEAEKYSLHSIVRKEKHPLKTLTRSEAIMKMELSKDVFLIYIAEEDRKLKVIYRMSDGNFGVIEPV